MNDDSIQLLSFPSELPPKSKYLSVMWLKSRDLGGLTINVLMQLYPSRANAFWCAQLYHFILFNTIQFSMSRMFPMHSLNLTMTRQIARLQLKSLFRWRRLLACEIKHASEIPLSFSTFLTTTPTHIAAAPVHKGLFKPSWAILKDFLMWSSVISGTC